MQLFLTLFSIVGYKISPQLFLIIIFIQIFTSFLLREVSLDDKILLNFFISFSFFGVSIGPFKIYDLVILVYIFYVFFIKRYKINKYSYKGFIFVAYMLVSIFVLQQYEINQFLEITRYLLSAFALVLFASLTKISELQFSIMLVATVQAFQAFLVYIGITFFGFISIETSIYSIDIFTDSNETRLSGFFSDPNKFMATILIYIVFLFLSKHNQKKYRIYLIILFAISLLSLSRTPIISIIIFLFLELFGKLFKDRKIVIFLELFFIIIIMSFIIIDFDSLLSSINQIFTDMSTLLGRERTAAINSSISQDNRYLVWKQAFSFIKDSPFFGYGPLSYEKILPYPTHNTFLNILLDYGLVGSAIYIYVLTPLLKLKLEYLIPFIIIPMFLLDLGNFRILFVLLGLLLGIFKKNLKGVVEY